MKAGTSDALVLTSLSRQAFNSDVDVGAASSSGPPGYQSVSFHVRMARMNHLFKLVDEKGVILGGAILFRQEDTLNVGRIFVDPQHFRKGYGTLMMREIENLFPDVKALTLDTPVWNTRTNAFYTRLGYSEVKRDTEFVYYTLSEEKKNDETEEENQMLNHRMSRKPGSTLDTFFIKKPAGDKGDFGYEGYHH